MKTIYFTMIALLIATQAFAAVDMKKQESTLSSVLKMEKNQDHFGAVLTAAQASAEILNQLRVDEIVSVVDTKLTEIRKEVITHKYHQSAGFKLLFGLLSGSGEHSWDAAEIITSNPDEVAGFSRKISADFRNVQSLLKDYVQKNEMALAYAKAFTLKTVQLATQLSPEDRKNLLPMIKTSVQFSKQLRFSGAQNVLKCVKTNYANRSQSLSGSLGGWLLSLDLSESETQLAHTNQECESSVNNTTVTETILISAKLHRLDRLIDSYNQRLGLMEVVEVKAPLYPTWGLPDYDANER